MHIKPTRDWVILEPIKEPRLIILSKDKSRVRRGRVLATGAGKLSKNGTLIPPDVCLGDIVIFRRYAAKTFYVERQQLLFVENHNILGVVESREGTQTTQRNTFFTQGSDNDNGFITKKSP